MISQLNQLSSQFDASRDVTVPYLLADSADFFGERQLAGKYVVFYNNLDHDIAEPACDMENLDSGCADHDWSDVVGMLDAWSTGSATLYVEVDYQDLEVVDVRINAMLFNGQDVLEDVWSVPEAIQIFKDLVEFEQCPGSDPPIGV